MIAPITRWFMLLSVLLLNRPAFAQPDAEYREKLDQAAFQLIKTTVEFLTTDRQTFPNVQTTQCNCDSYDSLKAFIKQNDLVGADKLVDEAQRRAAQHIAQINQPGTALTETKEFLIQKIASGNRAERKNLPSYAAFEAALNGIINRTVSPGAATATPATQPSPTVSESAGLPDTLETPSPPITPTTNTQSNWISMAGIALFLSILSLIGVAFLTYTVLKSQKPEQSARDIQVDSQLAKLADRVTKLEVRKNQPNESFQVNAQLEALERAVRQLEQNQSGKPAGPAPKVPLEVLQSVPDVAADTEAAMRPSNRYRTPTVEPPRTTVFYARTADLGDGFSAGGLLTKPEQDTVFDVLLENDTQATYQISENPDAQRLALSDPYSYLNDACEYLTQPNPSSRIRTEQAGRLSLQGDKWKIVEKAKIRFIS